MAILPFSETLQTIYSEEPIARKDQTLGGELILDEFDLNNGQIWPMIALVGERLWTGLEKGPDCKTLMWITLFLMAANTKILLNFFIQIGTKLRKDWTVM